MKKPILIAMMALPMVLTGAASGLASDRITISDIQGAIPTVKQADSTIKPARSLRLNPNVQLAPNRNVSSPGEGLRERRCPRRCDETLNLQESGNSLRLSPSDMVERKGPRGPGGTDGLVQNAPRQQFR